jgi:CubicO group peptidase (beta-lactamase class C family)
MQRILVVILWFISIAATSQVLDSNQTKALDSIFSSWNSTTKPGMAVGVVRNGEVVFKKTYGMADISSSKKIDEQTQFWIASVSKQFTAMGITVLEKNGRLSVEDNISRYLPELAHLPSIKIKHLLHHTSGLRDGYTLVGMTLKGEKHYDPESVYGMIKKQKSLNFDPGSRYEYVNSNYVLLAMIIEKASGKSYEAFIKDDVFSKMGLRHSRVFKSDKGTSDAIGYVKTGNKYKSVKNFIPAIGSTGIMMSMEDAITLERSLQRNDGFLTLQDMLKTDDNLHSNHYQRGVEHYEFKGLEMVSHFGTDPGFRADILRMPQKNLSVIIFSNAGDYWDLSKNLFDVAGVALNHDQLITNWYKEKDLQTDSTKTAGLPGMYLDTLSGSNMRFVKIDKNILHISNGLHSYYAPTKFEKAREFSKQDNYEYHYQFDDNSLRVTRADGIFNFIKLDPVSIDAATQAKIKGRYFSNELNKTYRITKKKNTLRLTFLHILHSTLTPIADNTYYTEFAGGNVLKFETGSDGRVRLLFSRDGIKNLEFVKQ